MTAKKEMFDLSTLRVNPRNPYPERESDFGLLKDKINEHPKFLALRPIVYDDQNIEDGKFLILGGNKRFKALLALDHKYVPHEWVKAASDLTEEEKHEFVLADNVGFGSWDVDIVLEDWGQEIVDEWGIDLPEWSGVNEEDGEDGFSLPDGDREPFQQMTFTLADEQATIISNALSDIKKTDDYKYAETMGNENSNGNALYLIVASWAEQRTLS